MVIFKPSGKVIRGSKLLSEKCDFVFELFGTLGQNTTEDNSKNSLNFRLVIFFFISIQQRLGVCKSFDHIPSIFLVTFYFIIMSIMSTILLQLFHETVAIGLLQKILFHEDGIQSLGNSALDLVDHIILSITRLAIGYV